MMFAFLRYKDFGVIQQSSGGDTIYDDVIDGVRGCLLTSALNIWGDTALLGR